MPFQPGYAGPRAILIVTVDRLKRCETECTVIDSLRYERQPRRPTSVNASMPPTMSHHAKPMWVHEMKNRLRPSVSYLLFEIRLYCFSAMMPHECAGGITNAS